jgi:hypothetical protein
VLDALTLAGIGEASNLVQTGLEIEGVVERHEFDVAVSNGRLVDAALALSFERQNVHDLQRDYASAAWAIEDVRKREPDLPLAVLMVPPFKWTSKTYDQARYVFEQLDAQPVPEEEIGEWAVDVAERAAALV